MSQLDDPGVGTPEVPTPKVAYRDYMFNSTLHVGS
jgi:hypothetical protein